MHVPALGSLGVDIVVDVDAAAIRDFGELGLDVVNEGAEFADVDAATFLELVVQVGDEGTPHNEHLKTDNNSFSNPIKASKRNVFLIGVLSIFAV
jgi:hypothetical protein